METAPHCDCSHRPRARVTRDWHARQGRTKIAEASLPHIAVASNRMCLETGALSRLEATKPCLSSRQVFLQIHSQSTTGMASHLPKSPKRCFVTIRQLCEAVLKSSERESKLIWPVSALADDSKVAVATADCCFARTCPAARNLGCAGSLHRTSFNASSNLTR